jgi:hypothetical protein
MTNEARARRKVLPEVVDVTGARPWDPWIGRGTPPYQLPASQPPGRLAGWTVNDDGVFTVPVVPCP